MHTVLLDYHARRRTVQDASATSTLNNDALSFVEGGDCVGSRTTIHLGTVTYEQPKEDSRPLSLVASPSDRRAEINTWAVGYRIDDLPQSPRSLRYVIRLTCAYEVGLG